MLWNLNHLFLLQVLQNKIWQKLVTLFKKKINFDVKLLLFIMK